MDLRQLGEFGLIDRIQKRFPPPASTVLGIGDDAAAILPSKKQHLLLTTDTLIEGVHFDPAFSTFQEVGYKSVMVNVSDIAAMGGTPRYILISLGLTGRQRVEAIDQLYKGIERASRETGLDLIGGNIAFSTGPFFISPTVVGEIPKKEMVTRAGAGEGDHLYVTGTLGDAAAGLALLKKGIDTKLFGRLTRRYRAPQARWREGRLLAKARIPSAMIDLSDGLSSDLSHLMERSGLGAEIDAAEIPLSAPLQRAALQMGVDSIEYALNGGEDYELLFSVPERKLKKLELMIKNGLIKAYRIGKMAPRRTGLMLINPSGRRRALAPGGWDHLKKGEKG
ncbi:thiamine-phosphate kinase [Candidatus Manganitrophus noduliformans]|uniref:Thiamine-monophosphate kinase n=1 Tax=Candidatus Manganitrophus noduliformans TaxID=2606439 RepID=A0A7X6DLE9_9BACT|nr:thiamine-phosphate kinase [Candidatus Manganitrophus noduliformans]NKE69380.1 thiamine-phosphate kinase [Candidatus Manganitrophus noduliformans]